MKPNILNWRKRKLSLVIYRHGREKIIPYGQYRIEQSDNGHNVWELMPYGGKRLIDQAKIIRKINLEV